MVKCKLNENYYLKKGRSSSPLPAPSSSPCSSSAQPRKAWECPLWLERERCWPAGGEPSWTRHPAAAACQGETVQVSSVQRTHTHTLLGEDSVAEQHAEHPRFIPQWHLQVGFGDTPAWIPGELLRITGDNSWAYKSFFPVLIYGADLHISPFLPKAVNIKQGKQTSPLLKIVQTRPWQMKSTIVGGAFYSGAEIPFQESLFF